MTTNQNISNIVQFPQAIYAEMTPNLVAMKFVINYYEFKFRLCQKKFNKKYIPKNQIELV